MIKPELIQDIYEAAMASYNGQCDKDEDDYTKWNKLSLIKREKVEIAINEASVKLIEKLFGGGWLNDTIMIEMVAEEFQSMEIV